MESCCVEQKLVPEGVKCQKMSSNLENQKTQPQRLLQHDGQPTTINKHERIQSI
jgi:hypothetical protein